MIKSEWSLHWAMVMHWIVANGIQVLPRPPFSPDLALADFFLFRKVRRCSLVSTCPRRDSKLPGRGSSRVSARKTAAAFRRWFGQCEKCTRVQGNYVKSS
jgi:hypothetical protein